MSDREQTIAGLRELAETFRHKPWCDHPIFSDATDPDHVCSGWLISIEGANVGVTDSPDGLMLTLYGTQVNGEVRFPVAAAETVASVLAALGHDEQADLIREALPLPGVASEATPGPVDEVKPTRIEQDVCEHCGHPIRRTDIDPMWRHLEGRTGSAFCASPLDSTVATPRVQPAEVAS